MVLVLVPKYHTAADAAATHTMEAATPIFGVDVGASGTCGTLHSIADQVHLWSMMASSSWALLPHWLAHYLGLGVRASNVHVILDAVDVGAMVPHDALARMKAALSASGVADVSVYNTSAGRGFDDVKLGSLNGFISTLPAGSYIVYADADEFFSYPCGDLVQRLRDGAASGRPALCAKMMDRLPEGSVKRVAAYPSLHEQFPRCGRLRKAVGGAVAPWTSPLTLKLTLMPAGGAQRLRYLTSHHAVAWVKGRKHDFGGFSSSGCQLQGFFSHFTVSAEQLDLLEYKAAQYREVFGESGTTVGYEKTLKLFERREEGRPAAGWQWAVRSRAFRELARPKGIAMSNCSSSSTCIVGAPCSPAMWGHR